MGRIRYKPRYYHDIYRHNKDSNAYCIDVSLDDYDDVYDDWDPSPFKKRDIELEFQDFIWDSSLDIPLRYALDVVLVLPELIRNDAKEQTLREAYRNFYRFRVRRAMADRKRVQKKILMNLMLAFLFLFIGYFYSFGESVILNVLNEGIFIGGWVFLWEVFTLLFVTMKEQNHEIKFNQRLLEATLIFQYRP